MKLLNIDASSFVTNHKDVLLAMIEEGDELSKASLHFMTDYSSSCQKIISGCSLIGEPERVKQQDSYFVKDRIAISQDSRNPHT